MTRDRPVVRLRSDLVAHVVQGEGIFLVSERGAIVIEGQLAISVVSRIDGMRVLDEIVSELTNEYPEEWIRHAIDQLVTSGLVVIEHMYQDQSLAKDATFYEMGGVELSMAAGRLANATVAVRVLGGIDSSGLIAHLRASGVGTVLGPVDSTEDVFGETLSIVVTDDYMRPELDLFNRSALAAQRSWMLCRPVGSVVWVGPLFRPTATACWSCLAHRMAANFQSYSYIQSRLRDVKPIVMSNGHHRVASAVGDGLVALEALRTITGIQVAEPSIVTTDLLTGDSSRHYVTCRAQCPACGDGTMMAVRALEPVLFSHRSKASTTDGGHRAIQPEVMVARFSRQVSPLTGVVNSLQQIPIAGSPLWVFTAGQNLGRRPSDLRAFRLGLRSSSCGKGMSEIQARASAIGEAIERSSGVFQGDELRRRASLVELGDAAIHPNDCMLFSERQYEHRNLWNLGASGFRFVFEPFLEDELIDWSPVWSVTKERVRWLPTRYLYYGYSGNDRLFAHADSNGCAAGTSLEDAALQGFFELIERDSVALWWYNRVQRPGINLDSFKEPYFDRLREIYAGLGREVWVLDLTTDFGIPAVGAFSRVLHGDREDILFAFGAHFDSRVAVVRALTEMNQFLPALLPATEGASEGYLSDPAFAKWCQSATLANQPYLAPDPKATARTEGSWQLQATEDIAVDLARCQSITEARNLELLVLDQTRPDVGLPVVRVIVPGLRHFWPRFAPGRLYDVPVNLGWCRSKTEEHLLNPISIFI